MPALVDQLKGGLDAPICLTWELTYACNLECANENCDGLCSGEETACLVDCASNCDCEDGAFCIFNCISCINSAV